MIRSTSTKVQGAKDRSTPRGVVVERNTLRGRRRRSKGETEKQSKVGEGRGERRIKRVGDKKQRAGEETSLASKGSQADPD